MQRREISKTKYLAVFATTTLIFVIGVFIGHEVTIMKLNTIDDLEQNMKVDTMAIELQYLLIAEDPCSYINATPLTEELYGIGTKLDYMENQLGESNPSVLRIKEYYSLLEVRHWLYMKKVNKECNKNSALILYFYSNEGDCPTCKEQGFVLNYLHTKYPSMNIYSFDTNIKDIALDTIKQDYGIKKETPILIINDKVYVGFMSSKDIEKLT